MEALERFTLDIQYHFYVCKRKLTYRIQMKCISTVFLFFIMDRAE